MLQSLDVSVGDWDNGVERGRAWPQRVDVQRAPRHEGAAAVEGVLHFETQLSSSGTDDLRVVRGRLARRECGQCQEVNTREENHPRNSHFDVLKRYKKMS